MESNLFDKKIVFLIFSSFLLIPFVVIGISVDNPLNADTFEELIDSLIDFIFWVGVAVFPIMILIAAFYFLTAAGNPQRVQTAKKVIFWSIVGFTIILLAKGIISVVKQILGG